MVELPSSHRYKPTGISLCYTFQTHCSPCTSDSAFPRLTVQAWNHLHQHVLDARSEGFAPVLESDSSNRRFFVKKKNHSMLRALSAEPNFNYSNY